MNIIGIDLGGHTISAAVIEYSSLPRVLSRIDVQTPASRQLDEVISCIADIISKLAEGHDVDKVGIGVPAFLDTTRQKIRYFTNFSQMENIKFTELLKNELKSKNIFMDVYMENDANCSALGEGYCGAARGCSDFAVFTLGTGIGIGVVLNGKLVIGAHGMAGESGHMPITDSSLVCGCGGIGHFESSASADHIENKAGEAGLPEDFKMLWERRKEENISAIIEPALDVIARGMASIIVTMDPEVIVLNGGMSRADGIMEELSRRIVPYLPVPFRPFVNIVVSKCGADAAIYGAGSLCIGRR